MPFDIEVKASQYEYSERYHDHPVKLKSAFLICNQIMWTSNINILFFDRLPVILMSRGNCFDQKKTKAIKQ